MKAGMFGFAASIMVFSATAKAVQPSFEPRTTSVFGPFVEYEVSVPGLASGRNPFDVIADAVFTHTATGETRRTGLFYAGGDAWRFRFTADRPGEWTFVTISEPDPGCSACTTSVQLAGVTGVVDAEPDPDALGFQVGVGTRWARQRGDGAFVPFVPQYVMAPRIQAFADMDELNGFIETFIEGHGFTGVHIPPMAGWWFDLDSPTAQDGRDVNYGVTGSNPDLETFELMEEVIVSVEAAGGVTHIWEWGDEARDWSPVNDGEGENGIEHRRLLRYIAARLGPIPGWSLGYGFDLDEWTTPGRMGDRSGYLRSQLGWPLFFGGRSTGPNDGRGHASEAAWHRSPQTYAGYEHHSPDYEAFVDAINATAVGDADLLDIPVMSEDRNRIRFNNGEIGGRKDYDFDETRQGLWLSMMAGGVSNIWGNLYIDGGGTQPHDSGSLPYPNADEIKTWATFFNERFGFPFDLNPANAFTDHVSGVANDNGPTPPNAYASYAPDTQLLVFYGEQTDRVRLNFSLLPTQSVWAGGARIVAVDVRAPYAEIDLGVKPLIDTDAAMPFESDWAIAAIPACPTDLSGDGFLDGVDVEVFVQLFADGDARADVTDDQSITLFDLLAWLEGFDAGCP